MRTCGLYIRVSTDRQAKIEEGSLKNQDHHLTQYIEMRNSLHSEQWVIVDRYIDEGRSAKDTNRPAYQRMIEDVKRKRINTVVCLTLSRISRSTRDLLHIVEFFKQHNVEFVCLKEQFDTTTPNGKFSLTIMGAMNEFEREQTGERTRAAFLARAERGLWNGGQIFGYDIDPKRKGYLLVNGREAEIVRAAFDIYLKVGSVNRTKVIMNEQGFTTKSYVTRRGKSHPSEPFPHASIHQLLRNYAYIGKKEINKTWAKQNQKELTPERRYHLVNAVWPPIVDEKIFHEVQKLLKQNLHSHNNGSAPTKHFYLLNGSLLYCHKCGSVMEGRNGHGHKERKAYYYYVCQNKNCRLKFPQVEVEKVIGALLGQMAQSDGILSKVVSKLNVRIKAQFPNLEEQRRHKESELRSVNEEAQKLLSGGDWTSGGKVFVDEKLQSLSDRRRILEEHLAKLAVELRAISNQEVNEQTVKEMLDYSQSAFFDEMKPYKRKELLRIAIKRLEISDSECAASLRLTPALPTPEWLNVSDSTAHLGRGAILDAQANLSVKLAPRFFNIEARRFIGGENNSPLTVVFANRKNI